MNSITSLLFLIVFIFVEKSTCKYARSHRSHREIHHDVMHSVDETARDRYVRGERAAGERHRHAKHELGRRQGYFQKRRSEDFINHPNLIDIDAIDEKYVNDAIGMNKGGRKTNDADLKSFEGAATFPERVVKKQESTLPVEGEAPRGRDRPQYDASGNRLTVCAFDYAVQHALDKAAQRVLDATATTLDLLMKDAFEEIKKATLTLEPTKISQLTSITECAYVAENMNKCFRIPNNVSNSSASNDNFTECLHVHDKFKKCLKNLQTESSVARSVSIATGAIKNTSPKPTESPETLPARSSDTPTKNAIEPLNVSAESIVSVAPSTSTTFGAVESLSPQSTGMPENSAARYMSTNNTEANGSKNLSAAELFNIHMKMVDQFNSQKPTPELISVGKNYGNILPNCTVLHRCRCLACCHDETMEYGPASETIVGLYFQIKGKESRTYQLLEFTNHTSCKCRKKVLSNEIVQDTRPMKDVARTMNVAVNVNNYSSSSKDAQDERLSSPR